MRSDVFRARRGNVRIFSCLYSPKTGLFRPDVVVTRLGVDVLPISNFAVVVDGIRDLLKSVCTGMGFLVRVVSVLTLGKGGGAFNLTGS